MSTCRLHDSMVIPKYIYLGKLGSRDATLDQPSSQRAYHYIRIAPLFRPFSRFGAGPSLDFHHKNAASDLGAVCFRAVRSNRIGRNKTRIKGILEQR